MALRKKRKRFPGISDLEEQAIRLFHLLKKDFPGISFEYTVGYPGVSKVVSPTPVVIDYRGKLRLDQNDGTKVPTAQLGDGVADNTKFLRGDQTWQPAGAGANLLSTLVIDVDKDWAGKFIYNLAALTTGADIGDIYAVCLDAYGNQRVVRIPTGPKTYVLTSRGPGHCPTWAPSAGPLSLTFIVEMGYEIATSLVIINKFGQSTVNQLDTNIGVADSIYNPGWFSTKEIALSTEIATAGFTVDASRSEDIAVATGVDVDVPALVDGAVSDDGGVQTDETAEARSPATNDMTLIPTPPQVNDAYYFGSDAVFCGVKVWIGILGIGVWDLTWEYWDGVAWSALSNVNDWWSDDWRNKLGDHCIVRFDIPEDWALTTVQAMNLYWVRARVSVYTQLTTLPVGNQVWVLPSIPISGDDVDGAVLDDV